MYAAGGGGSGGQSAAYAIGGSSIGGNGSNNNSAIAATNAVANTGSGGGGSNNGTAGGGGGSGIIIVRFSLPAVPFNSAAPTISGVARTGETLTALTGTWSGSPTSFTYQWKRSATSGGVYSDMATAINPTYVVSDSDVGYVIKVSVIATNSVGSSSASES